MLNSIGPMELVAWLLFGLPWAIIIAVAWLVIRLVMVKGFKSQSPKWALAGFWKRFLIVWAAFTVIGGTAYALSLTG